MPRNIQSVHCIHYHWKAKIVYVMYWQFISMLLKCIRSGFFFISIQKRSVFCCCFCVASIDSIGKKYETRQMTKRNYEIMFWLLFYAFDRLLCHGRPVHSMRRWMPLSPNVNHRRHTFGITQHWKHRRRWTKVAVWNGGSCCACLPHGPSFSWL